MPRLRLSKTVLLLTTVVSDELESLALIPVLLLWTVLPPMLRRSSRPVAASDYWSKGPIRRYIIGDVFRGVLIDRVRSEDSADPIEIMAEALDGGDSLIIFPEGVVTRTNDKLNALLDGVAFIARTPVVPPMPT